MDDQLATERSESNEQHDLNELRIVLLGVSGAGKSPTANAILGREAFRESRTRESEIQRGRVEDRNISIIDTPGFFNTQLTDEEQQKQMMKSLDLSHPGPHVFLLLINLETFRDDQRNIVEKILENFGEEVLLFTMVLFVGREKISKRDFNQIIESEETQKILNYFEGRFHVINSKTECDSYQITMLLKKSEEMVKNNGKQNYCKKIYLKNQEQQEQKERIEQKRENKCLGEKGAADQGDPSTHLESQEEMEGLIEEIAKELQNPIVDLRIVLVGKTGSGKSSAGNTIIGNFEFEHKTSLTSVTRRCQRKKTMVENKIISVIDTPGLFDTSISEDQLKNELVRCVYMSVPGPHVFLLVIRLDVRFTNEEKNTVQWIQENFGEEAARYTIILFTHADILKKEPLDEYIKKCPDLESLVQSCSSQYHAFNNENMRSRSQVTELLKKIEKMVNKNKGEHYTSEIYKKAQEKIEDQAFKKRVRDYGLTGLAVIGGGVVVAGAVTAAGGPSAVIAAAVGGAKAKLGLKTAFP